MMRIHAARGTVRASSKCWLLHRVAVMAMAAAMAVPVLAAAETNKAGVHFGRYLIGKAFKPTVLPFGARKSERVTVVVQMSADPVAVVRAKAPDHKIIQAQHDSIAAQIATQHAAIEPEIIGRGGRVLAKFHDALNGVKVQIDRDQIESLKAVPGVVNVLSVRSYHLSNAASVPFIGAPQVWQGVPGYRGEGVKIAMIDTGIDYTHANFAGPGTVAAYNQALSTDTLPADPRWFGPKAPKVKGGTDLVGDAYDASLPATDPNSLPKPDPNPLDCEGHGSHTAGTAAGFGVAADGTTYQGPYESAAYSPACAMAGGPTAGSCGFQIGPGVAPKADLYAVKVFGCTGVTNVVVDAIDWAIHHDMDVINMSLGSEFGTPEDADSIAAENATRAGVIVVASAGNDGPAPYIIGNPATSAGTVAVAAMDSHKTYPGALVTLSNGSIEAQDSNGLPLPGALPIVVLRTSTGAISLGCDPTEYANAGVAGKLVVTRRGTCARVLRAQLGQQYGAAAVAMINSSAGYPPYEGPITGVSIPFLGVLAADGGTLAAATSASSFTANTITNPSYRTAASFSSGGPRFGDSLLKPNVAAPGVSILSTAVGTGNAGTYLSGTSQASPHVAGVAALVAQAHPKWTEYELSAAVVETADPKQLLDFNPQVEGAGLVQPLPATRTQAVVLGADTDGEQQGGQVGEHGISFGFSEFLRDYHSEREVVVRNLGDAPITFNIGSTPVSGVPHTIHVSNSAVVRPHSETPLSVSLSVPVGTVGSTHDLNGNDVFQDVSGYLTLTPAAAGMNNGVALNVPYYLVPRARSAVFAFPAGPPLSPSHPRSNVVLANLRGGIAGFGDFYAWGLSGKPQGMQYYDTRAVGVQSNLTPEGTDSFLVFAINTFQRFSSASGGEFDILIDVNGDGIADYDVFGFDLGQETTGSFNGTYASFVYDFKTQLITAAYYADAPTDGSTVLLPVYASDLGLTSANPRFSYTEITTSLLDGTQETLPGSASFNAFTPAICTFPQGSAKVPACTGGSNVLVAPPVAPNNTALVPVGIDRTEWEKTPALGLMAVVEDNSSGERQASLLPVGH